jgi:hypothetical protein
LIKYSTGTYDDKGTSITPLRGNDILICQSRINRYG